MNRVCKKCGVEKPLDKFTKNKACKEGHTNLCRDCANVMQSKFRSENREYVNLQAKEYGHKKHPIRAKRAELLICGRKMCSKCGQDFELGEFIKGRCICFECRTGHERGFYESRNSHGQYNKRFTAEEQKIKRILYAKKWSELNPEKRKYIEKKSRSKPENKIKHREWSRRYYHLNPHREAIIRYQKSEKGITASHKAKVKWAENNPDKIKIKDKRQISQLNDHYVISKIKRQVNIMTVLLRQYPELIEAKRIQIKLKRLANEKCN